MTTSPPPPPTLREHLREQLRLTFADPAERLIGAAMIALLEPSGRLAVGPAALAEVLGADAAVVASVRERMMRFDPTGMFARDLKDAWRSNWPKRTGSTRRCRRCWTTWNCWPGTI